jgi:hypothetical protein
VRQQSIDGAVADIWLHLASGVVPGGEGMAVVVVARGIEGARHDRHFQLDLRDRESTAGRNKPGEEIAVDFDDVVALKNPVPKAVA